ncbi:MAG: CoA transferase subunit A [Proteobacteria bacterium]|nr:CoA transferase subunit A [Pseudomonadota bacterium]
MNIGNKGRGILFTNPDPDQARAFFRDKKSDARSMKNKVVDLKSAISNYVHDGDYLAIGGFGANRTPLAACHEIVRQKKKKLGFLGHTSTHDMQILSAGEVYDRIDVSYGVGLEARGLSRCSRAYMESGTVRVTEWTNYALTARLRAASMGLPFMPVREMLGTDTFAQSGAVQAACPFTGKPVALVPALYPDVAVIHVHEADCFGNARFQGIAIADIELAHASKRLIITTEKLVNHDEISRDPALTQIPFYLVDAVCEVPYGAYPGGMPYAYFSDEHHIRQWLDAEKDPKTFRDFLDREIFGCKDHNDYLNLHGGLERMSALRAEEFFLHKEDHHDGV